ncbi:MAG TPA: hypothetical protein VMH04_17195 [Candidatus Solibacter sp.]|nr:hypothetical protein [Candidatus Solibacter sp.]
MNRFWIVAMLAGAGLFFWGIGYVVSPNGGDLEFQKMLEATQHVKSFRGAYVDTTQHTQRLWEVDCTRNIVHKQSRDAQSDIATEDQILVGLDRYSHQSDGSWLKIADKHVIYSGGWYCDNLAQGNLRDLLPDARAMLRSAMFGKGDKKTVNGVRCQDWQFAMKASTSGVKGTVCIGLQDHLPYEMTTDGTGHYSYSDYNRPIDFEAPEAILQQVSVTGSN